VQIVVDVHLVIAFVLALGSIGLAILAWRDRRAGSLPASFFRGLSHLERLLLLQAVIGVVLYLDGLRPTDPLHLLYGGVMLFVAAIDQGIRPGRGLRDAIAQDYGRFNEPVIYAALCLVLFLAAGRAITTGIWGF
jgi:heme A synthase